jgi:hypothetical protein
VVLLLAGLRAMVLSGPRAALLRLRRQRYTACVRDGQRPGRVRLPVVAATLARVRPRLLLLHGNRARLVLGMLWRQVLLLLRRRHCLPGRWRRHWHGHGHNRRDRCKWRRARWRRARRRRWRRDDLLWRRWRRRR